MQPVGAILSDPVGQRAILFLIAASGLWFWVPAESVLTWSAMCRLFEVCMCCFFCFLMCVAPVFDRYILSDIKDLLLALFKARLILSVYLDLQSAPAWRQGFAMVLVLFCALVLALYFAG